MRSLYFSDLHGHVFREFSEIRDGMNSRLCDCVEVLQKIYQFAIDNKIDDIRFLGDLFHLKNNLDSHVIKHIMEIFIEMANRFPLIIIPGNHDYRAWTHDPVLLKFMQDFGGMIRMGDAPGWINPKSADIQIYAEPYTRKTKELVERISNLEIKEENNIFLGHQDIIGVQYYGFTVKHGLNPDDLSKKFRWSFIGHYHAPMKIRKNVISVGAPLQHNFNDAGGRRGWWVHDSESGELNFIENDFSPRFIDLNLEQDNEIDFSDDKNFYRIKINGAKPVRGLENIKWKRVTYEFQPKKKSRSSLRFSDSNQVLISKYVEARAGKLNKRKLIKIGMRYL